MDDYNQGEVVLSALSHLFQNNNAHTQLQPLDRMKDVLIMLDIFAPAPATISDKDLERPHASGITSGGGANLQQPELTARDEELLRNTEEIAKQVGRLSHIYLFIYLFHPAVEHRGDCEAGWSPLSFSF